MLSPYKKNLLVVFLIGLLMGCATQRTFLKNDVNGQLAECGGDRSGSMMFGAIGYAIQQSDAEDCVNRYLQQGFKVVGLGAMRNTAAKPLPKAVSNKQENLSQLTPPLHSASTGFIYAGYIITNNHAIKGAKRISIQFTNGEKTEGTINKQDERNDIVFIKPNILPESKNDIAIGNSALVKVADKVFTLGFPMGPDFGNEPRYSEGVVNALTGAGNDPRYFQVSVPIQHGNSGGPLFNEKGELIGIVTASMRENATAMAFGGVAPQNVNFAVKSTFLTNLFATIPEVLVAPTNIVVVPSDSNSLSRFIKLNRDNIVLINVEYWH